MKVCILGSGSSGNAIYVESGATRILVDAGLSAREVVRRLREVGVEPCSLSAILISHEHIDHVRSAGVLARRYKPRLWANASTLRKVGDLLTGDERVEEFSSGCGFDIGNLSILPFSVPHDAADPSQFLITNGRASVGIATDLGFVSRLVMQRLEEAGLVILESNHDERMLLEGPYPWPLKQRVRGRKGHLSNRAAAKVLGSLANNGLTRAVLAHLSEENNSPDAALQASRSELKKVGAQGFQITAAWQHQPSGMIAL